MKKLIIAAAIVCAAVVSHAAAVGWTCLNANADFRGGDYSVFVVGMNGVTGAAQIKSIVEAGGLEAADSLAFYTGGSVTSAGAATLAANASGKTITWTGPGTETYEAFIVMQSSDGTKGTYTSTASISLANDTDGKQWAFANQGTATANNKFDVAPEPTSGLLLLIGVAGLALRRRRA